MATAHLVCSHNYALVALSVLIAMFASYASLDLAGRVTAARGWIRAVWLLGGPVQWGLAFGPCIHWDAGVHPAVPVAYHWPTVLLSLFGAVLAFGHCAVRGEPAEDGCVPSVRRKYPDGWGYCEHALHRHGRYAYVGYIPL